jgi:transposase-like protein
MGRPRLSAADYERRMRASALAPRRRWTPTAKFDVVAAIRAGHVTAHEVCAAHGLQPGEVADWIARGAAAGVEGLSVTRKAPR